MAEDVEQLRAQLALAQKRASVATELRQLAESYKAKAERLSKTLADERERAGAQSEVWKQQLKSLRVRARTEKEHSRQLEERIESLMRNERGGTPRGDSWHTPSPRSAPFSGSSAGHTTPTNGVKGALRQGVGKVLSSASERVDSALDKVDGLVERLARNTKKGEYTPASTDGD
jgi:hypothetical protein